MLPKKIYRGTPAAGAPATVYTVTNGTDGVTASGGMLVKSIIASNVTGSAATISINIGGVALVTAQSVAANSTLIIESGVVDVLVPTDVIQAGQGTAAAITLRINGVSY